jgi:hypothetical protein
MLTQDQYAQNAAPAAGASCGSRTCRVANVQRFVQMWLTLGQDCIPAAGSGHRPEIDEALGLATHRWGRLLDMEAQIIREEQTLAARGKTLPTQPGDEMLPDRTISQRDAAYLDETKHRKAALAELKEQAKREREELEALRR